MNFDGPTIAIIGGTVVNSDWSAPATVLVEGSRVRALLSEDDPVPTADQIVDATGKLVMPGGVDPHCHVATTIGAFTTLDDYESASIAALYGGTTTIVDFAIPLPGQAPLDAVRQRRDMAEISRCSTALHGCIVDWDDTVPGQLREMAELGVRTIKLFTTYRGDIMADANTVLRVMQVLAELDGLAYVHAESDALIRNAQSNRADVGKIGAGDHATTRPSLAEAAAVADVLASAETAGAAVYFVHQTTQAAVDLVQAARRNGLRAYTETCPHYLALNNTEYSLRNPERFVCCPPLRSPGEANSLRRLLHSGAIHTVGSDHCCFSLAQKREHSHDVRVMPNGMPGVETRLPVLFSRLVVDEGLPLERFVALTSTNPARLNGLYPRKGVIAPGADADIVLLDPAGTKVLSDASALHMASDYTPYDGQALSGWPSIVFSNGSIVIDGDDFLDPGPVGSKLDAAPFPQSMLC